MIILYVRYSAVGGGFSQNELILEFPTKSMPSGFRGPALALGARASRPLILRSTESGRDARAPRGGRRAELLIPPYVASATGLRRHGSRCPQFHPQLRAPAPRSSRRASARPRA